MANRASSDPDGDSVGAAAAFDLLGHETRLAIVEALADARRLGWQPAGLTFSELRKAVGVRDAGRFNYHLDALRGTFVVKREDEYVLTNAGFELEGAVRSGVLAGGSRTRSGTVDRSCPACERPIRATYEDDTLLLSCPEHGDVFVTGLPPAAVEGRDLESVVRLGLTRSWAAVEKARAGACPHCWGRMTATAPAGDGATPLATTGDDPADRQVVASFECRDCGLVFWLPVGVCVASHPAVVAYYHERGADPGGSAILGLELATNATDAVASEEPTRIEVRVSTPKAAEGLVLTLDGETAVVDVERTTDTEGPRSTRT